ncbi:hypothetical protein BpHYR1_050421 [Brachionus plicatilis]|uniref:Uncharacterized protein n=1 Tax=Brachionus plicatilis TaxID=10195 RepID=A0A3M7RQE8_BRAPC|nr:hypothetical protein BpHYR1_050421 [Brachionus plicatilis]
MILILDNPNPDPANLKKNSRLGLFFCQKKLYKFTRLFKEESYLNYKINLDLEIKYMVCSIVFYNNFTYNFENAFKKCDVSNLFFKKIFGESKDMSSNL